MSRERGFSESDIWDMTDLIRDAVMMPILKLQDLHRMIMAETVRIRVELEVKGDDGKYPTSLEDFVEPKGSVTTTDRVCSRIREPAKKSMAAT